MPHKGACYTQPYRHFPTHQSPQIQIGHWMTQCQNRCHTFRALTVDHISDDVQEDAQF